MKNSTKKELQDRPKFLQVSMFILFTFTALSLNARDFSVKIARKPSSAPEEEVMVAPTFEKPLMATILSDDDAGIMSSMRESLKSWDARDEYAKNWDLKSTGLFQTPTADQRKQYVKNNILPYLDKRLAGEVKNAEEGSTLHAVGKVEKSLRPNAEVAVSKYINLKFKVRVLQGKAIMELRNPWVECSTQFTMSGKVKVLTKKDFNESKTSSGVEFNANDASWVAFLDHQLTDRIHTRVSSTQNNQSIFNNNADKRLEMTASFPVDL